MNAFFDGYVHAKTNLKEFVDQYDNALKKKIENENCADFQSFNVTISCIYRSPIEKRYQDLYTNAKFREVQQQLTGIIDLDSVLLKANAIVKTYLVKDEVHVEDFTKLVTHSVDFSEDDAVAKWDQREDANRYSSLLNICYKMITCAASSKKYTEDAMTKLNAMIDLYEANQELASMIEKCLNVDGTIKDTTTIGSSTKVLSPRVVRGKGRPPSLRKASRMEKDLQKVKEKMKKAKERENRDEEDTPIVDTCRMLFGLSNLDVSNAILENVPAADISGTQSRETVIQSQESMQFGLDGLQLQHVEFDDSQLRQ
ncbi:protein FAR-RED ELONGATED HYPOCOTYL 3-like [Juglans microcarpa x Juglans regia]|uniref:protein FAR-RED ELONGATED HYPOCOTYL 3-like n=1 Tax=Juglans microcarpa x Juglans regia TaxID=2249226 RepID=UPI001B7F6A9A|nr:protein FAR-RED ELONGATED HYPOCOTYL 3-like [Juglans microcarpa x Juglans regia]